MNRLGDVGVESWSVVSGWFYKCLIIFLPVSCNQVRELITCLITVNIDIVVLNQMMNVKRWFTYWFWSWYWISFLGWMRNGLKITWMKSKIFCLKSSPYVCVELALASQISTWFCDTRSLPVFVLDQCLLSSEHILWPGRQPGLWPGTSATSWHQYSLFRGVYSRGSLIIMENCLSVCETTSIKRRGFKIQREVIITLLFYSMSIFGTTNTQTSAL